MRTTSGTQRHRPPGRPLALMAAGAALRGMGASSVTVCTPGGNVGSVAVSVSAGFEKLPDVTDFCRPA